MSRDVRITSVTFRNFKALQNFSLHLHDMNILVGPNNSGKSTILAGFRALEVALRRARSRNVEVVTISGRAVRGHKINPDHLPISLENVHTNYGEEDSVVDFRLSNKNSLRLIFPPDGGCVLVCSTEGRPAHKPSTFKTAFPIEIAVVPVLGPLEHRESVVERDTVVKALNTHRAARHFRNYWRYFGEGFNDFKNLVQATWPGMDIDPPERALDLYDNAISMFCREDRIARELYWSGFGFQVWCQLLTHIVRARGASLLVVDEPEIYLHPELQRQLLSILRAEGPDILMATHSTEIMGDSDPSEIVLVDKTNRNGRRLREVSEVQLALDLVGSVQNLALTQLARNRRVLFVEGASDFRIIRRFAKILGYEELAAGIGVTLVESAGFSSWHKIKSLSWGLEKTIGNSLRLAAVYDRDYWPEEQIQQMEKELEDSLGLVIVLKRKEMENYLLSPVVLQRAVERTYREYLRRGNEGDKKEFNVSDCLLRITEACRADTQAQYIAKRVEFFQRDRRDGATLNAETIRWFETMWSELETRMAIVPGKQVLHHFRNDLSTSLKITLTESKILDSFTKVDVPADMVAIVQRLESYRCS